MAGHNLTNSFNIIRLKKPIAIFFWNTHELFACLHNLLGHSLSQPILGRAPRYPDSQKLTHALLKIGYIHAELGQREEAERVLNDLIQRYPESTAAGLARKRLQRIRSG